MNKYGISVNEADAYGYIPNISIPQFWIMGSSIAVMGYVALQVRQKY